MPGRAHPRAGLARLLVRKGVIAQADLDACVSSVEGSAANATSSASAPAEVTPPDSPAPPASE